MQLQLYIVAVYRLFIALQLPEAFFNCMIKRAVECMPLLPPSFRLALDTSRENVLGRVRKPDAKVSPANKGRRNF